MIYCSLENKEEVDGLLGLGEIKSKQPEVRLQEKLGEQDYHCDSAEVFQPITKTVTDTSEKLREESKPSTKAEWGFE